MTNVEILYLDDDLYDRIEILSIKNVARRNDLPKLYLKTYPHMYIDDNEFIWIQKTPTYGYKLSTTNNMYSQHDFENIVTLMKKCCEQLSNVYKLKTGTIRKITM